MVLLAPPHEIQDHRRRRTIHRHPLVVLVAVSAAVVVTILTHIAWNPEIGPARSSFVRSRRLSSIPLPSSFHFDGTSSDLAQQFYRRHVAGAVVEPLRKTHDDLPQRIQNRLDAINLRFDTLPPLLQRAVIWDSGYGLDSDPDSDLVKIYTVDGVAMSRIAVAQDEFRNTGCTTSNCSDPNGMASFRSKNCTGDQMLPATLCASESVTPLATHTSMWATGGSDEMVPSIGMLRHSWNDPVNNTDYVVFAVHTLPIESEPPWDNCPASDAYSSLIIPCDVYRSDWAVAKRWLEPQFGPIVTPWLEDLQAADRRHKVLMFAIVPLCVLGVVVFAMVTVMLIYKHRIKAHNNGTRHCQLLQKCGLSCCSASRLCGRTATRPPPLQHKDTWGGSLGRTLLSPAPQVLSMLQNSGENPDKHAKNPEHPNPNPNPKQKKVFDPEKKNNHQRSPDLPRRGSCPAMLSTETAAMATSDRMTHVLLHDLNLYDKRVALERIHFQRQLSHGGFGEVWLCELDGRHVAVKRLLRCHQRLRISDIEAFIDEIQITASLHHANIPKFLGVSWTTLDRLCMVTEYMAGGDLQSFLKRCGPQLTWHKEKKILAIGIARALQYLHSRAPVMIHRDVKSRNILVREAPLAAKVTDFGVSRSVQRECMTLGVGTPYWTAPEVLDGTTYTEKSDIYSFGVVLSEIDTCQSPYHELQHGVASDTDATVQPFHILKMVISGTIQPRFSAQCPLSIRDLATKCLHVCPASRPTARDVVTTLETIQWHDV